MYADDDVVQVHSVAEAYLYIMVARCRNCDRGPLRQRADLTKTSASPGGWALATACTTCGAEATIHFAIEPAPTRQEAQSNEVNRTAQRSQAIDLLGWLTLFQTILGKVEEQEDKQTRRQLAYEAAQCLDEALKFYDADNELPAEDAFFSEESRRRFRDHPQRFIRSEWRQRRLMLPDIAAKTKPRHEPLHHRKRRWWRLWRL
ncbi:MAG: hypothetical protein JXQ75_19765 [Phycisphaerae bacterium]|nr:hypothetical protein [Phycisphaerae bacterium]